MATLPTANLSSAVDEIKELIEVNNLVQHDYLDLEPAIDDLVALLPTIRSKETSFIGTRLIRAFIDLRKTLEGLGLNTTVLSRMIEAEVAYVNTRYRAPEAMATNEDLEVSCLMIVEPGNRAETR